MSHPNSNEQEKQASAVDDSLYYSLLFQLLKNESKVVELVVWRGVDEELHSAFAFTSNGNREGGSTDIKKKRTMIERVQKTHRSVVSGMKSGASESSNIQQIEVLCQNKRDDIVQAGFQRGLSKAEYETCVKKAEQLIGLEFDIAQANDVGIPSGVLNQQVTNEAAANQVDQGYLDFFRNINQSLEIGSTAFNIANELRHAAGCDRVSVLRIRGKQPKVIAVSGVAVVNRRAKEVKQLEDLVRNTCRTGQTFQYPDDSEKALPQSLQQSLSGYLADQSTRSLVIVPVESSSNESKDPTESNSVRHGDRKVRLVGAIAMEYFQQSLDSPAERLRNEKLTQCAGDSFRNAVQHRSLFLYPVWRVLGNAYEFLIGRHLSKSMIASTLLLAFSLAAIFVKAEYRLSCEGELIPETRRTVYAEIDGLVTGVMTNSGAAVSANQPLIQLENKELLIRQQELEGNMSALKERIDSIDRFSVGDPRNPNQAMDNKEQLAMERAGLKKQIETLEAQLEIVKRQIELQVVRSPIKGNILTANLVQELADRPVSKGAKLLEVADTDGQWIVELKLPDRKTGEFLRAQQALGENVQVVFVVSSDPDREHIGSIKSFELKLDTDETIGQYLRIEVDFEESDVTDINVGSEVIAYIQCGKRSWGFIWTKDVVDFIRKRILFPFG